MIQGILGVLGAFPGSIVGYLWGTKDFFLIIFWGTRQVDFVQFKAPGPPFRQEGNPYECTKRQ